MNLVWTKFAPSMMVDACACRSLTKNAWCVGDELLFAHIEDGESELSRARNALSSATDPIGTADAVRRLCKASKAAAADLRHGPEKGGFLKGRKLLEEAEHLVQKHLLQAMESGDMEATVILNLATAELKHNHREYGPRDEARNAAAEARKLAQQLKRTQWEGEALLLLAQCHVETEAEKAAGYAMDAVALFHKGFPLEEARATFYVGICRYHTMMQFNGLRHLDSALKMCRELGAHRWEALMLFATADLDFGVRRFRRGLSSARLAEERFKELGMGRGWWANCLRLRILCSTGLENCVHAQQMGHDIAEDLRAAGGVKDLKALIDVQAGLVASFVHEDRNDLALEMVKELQELASNMDDPGWEVNALVAVGKVHIERKELDRARVCFTEAKAMAQQDSDDIMEWLVMEALARLYDADEDEHRAIAQLDELHGLCQRTGDKMRMGWGKLRLCLVWGNKEDRDKHDNDMAMKAAEDAQIIFKEIKDRGGEASAWDRMAQAHIIWCDDEAEMDPKAAEAAALQCRNLHRAKGNKEFEAKMLQRVLARIYTDQGRHAEALKISEEAAEMARKFQGGTLLAEILSALVRLRLEQVMGDPEEPESQPVSKGKDARRNLRRAKKEAHEALQCAKEAGDHHVVGWMTFQKGQVDMVLGDAESAYESAVKAIRAGVDCHDVVLQANGLFLEAQVHLQLGDKFKALESGKRAHALAKNVGEDEVVENVLGFFRHFAESVGEEERGEEDKKFSQELNEFLNNFMNGWPDEDQKDGGESLLKTIVDTATQSVGLGPLEYDAPLVENGVDSLNGVTLRQHLKSLTGLTLPASLIFEHPTQREIVTYLMAVQSN